MAVLGELYGWGLLRLHGLPIHLKLLANECAGLDKKTCTQLL